ncbi:MAG: polyprenyl synthetase family protein [Phycisphaerales bacterium]|nr:polyprenyl synthetase family protein [Phycisphaerales bacterium]
MRAAADNAGDGPQPSRWPPADEAVWQPVAAIDRHLTTYVDGLTLPANLVDAVRYALIGGGKRLRPLLCWHSCAALGGPGTDSLAAGTAVELIHAFSLVHDDLPAMDDDDLRRGRPTLHIQAGEAMAILAGDCMLALAFGVLSERHAASLAAGLTLELVQGTTGMIAGQVHDTLGGFDPAVTPAQRVVQIHTSKTGALIRAACRMGAQVALAAAPGSEPVSRARLAAITAYAEAVGLMFQIVDDLLDVEQTPEVTGKRTRKDHDAGKLTFPAVFGVENARAEVERLRAASVRALEPLGGAAEPLRRLAELLSARDR